MSLEERAFRNATRRLIPWIAEDQTGRVKVPLVVLAGLLVVGSLLVLLLRGERPVVTAAAS